MLPKVITFNDLDGNEREQTFYFHMDKNEIYKMSREAGGSMSNRIRRVMETQNIQEIMDIIDDFITRSYGEKDDDGIHFRKIARDGHRLVDDFKQTPAYDKLFMELCSNPTEAAKFVEGIVPKDLKDKLDEYEKAGILDKNLEGVKDPNKLLEEINKYEEGKTVETVQTITPVN